MHAASVVQGTPYPAACCLRAWREDQGLEGKEERQAVGQKAGAQAAWCWQAHFAWCFVALEGLLALWRCWCLRAAGGLLYSLKGAGQWTLAAWFWMIHIRELEVFGACFEPFPFGEGVVVRVWEDAEMLASADIERADVAGHRLPQSKWQSLLEKAAAYFWHLQVGVVVLLAPR